MYQMLIAFSISVLAVTLAEMGDKTQLLAMAFATKYKTSKVLIGVFIATVLNHGLAVALGKFISQYKAIDLWIQILGSLSFILFGLWTIRGDKLDGDETGKARFGAITTVAIAFFIAELGDKTQFATIALSTKFHENPVVVLMGTTTGMMIADAIGIIFGVVMCKRIPEKTVKFVSAIAFILFGIIGTFQVADNKLDLNHGLIAVILVGITVLTGVLAAYLIKQNKLESAENPIVDEYCRVRDLEL